MPATKPTTTVKKNNSKQKRQDSASSTITSKRQRSGSVEIHDKKPVKSIDVPAHSPFLITGCANVLANHHDNVFNFANNSNVSVRSVTNKQVNQDFITMCDFLIDYGSTLKYCHGNRGGLHMGVHKFSRTRKEKLESFL